MLILLQANVPNLGHTGDLVKVKPGYARNYLFPRGFAIQASSGNKAAMEHVIRLASRKKAQALENAKALAETISALSLTIQKPVGEEDRIFGSVTSLELADALNGEDVLREKSVVIDRRAVTVLDDIRKVGVYRGAVRLHPEVEAEFKIWVVAQG